MSYDAKCSDLAMAFLSDEPLIFTPTHVDRLAQHIQDTIDQYLSDEVEEERQRLAEPPYDTIEEKRGLV